MRGGILKEGHNCCTIKNVDRLAMLIDGEEYYKAFFNTVPKAKRTVDILGWEVDSRINIGHINEEYPSDLRQYFNRVVTQNRNLHINVLSWRSPMYLLFGRENFAATKWRFETDRNIIYRQVGHPHMYGTHHEKMVIIDGSCAFLGGMDISRKRWDTRDHKLENPLRKDEFGKHYHPIHDVQLVFAGEMVQELKTYLQEKGNFKGDHESENIWPAIEAQEINSIPVALSRTNSTKRHREIEKLYLDAIHAAKDFIYIENQYFSCETIVNALCWKLMEENGPDIIIVLPFSYRGSFEKAIYTNERNKALKRLQRADRFNRLGFFYPDNERKDQSRFIVVHSKFMIVDNEFLTLGSANLNNRSLHVDSELNLSLEAHNNPEVKNFIEENLYRLLEEHLDTPQKELREKFEETKSLRKTIWAFQGKKPRTLEEINYSPTSFKEELMVLITPMVDVRFSLPKVHLVIFIFALFLMSLMFWQAPE